MYISVQDNVEKETGQSSSAHLDMPPTPEQKKEINLNNMKLLGHYHKQGFFKRLFNKRIIKKMGTYIKINKLK